MSLLEKMLELDPKKRFTAGRALEHRYFQSDPIAPDDPKQLGTINLGGDASGYHEFQTKKRRREAKAAAKHAEEEAKLRGEASDTEGSPPEKYSPGVVAPSESRSTSSPETRALVVPPKVV